MPCDYSKYPVNFKTEIRPAILKRANHRYEFCRINNYSVVRWNKEVKYYERACGNMYIDEIGMGNCTYKEARELADHWNDIEDVSEGKWIVICLTIAHLDHNPQNNDLLNLRALCNRCHLNYDKDLHRQNAKSTLNKKKGLQSLF